MADSTEINSLPVLKVVGEDTSAFAADSHTEALAFVAKLERTFPRASFGVFASGGKSGRHVGSCVRGARFFARNQNTSAKAIGNARRFPRIFAIAGSKSRAD